jgi:ferredoxin
MSEATLKLGGGKLGSFKDKVAELLPEGGNLNLCLTCGACSAGCPATGLEDMDPRKFLRMAALGLDEEITTTPWVWMCTMCTRCSHVCPMQINIPQLVFHARAAWPREKRPKGIVNSCDVALNTPTMSAMGTRPDDFKFVVEDVLEEVQETQEGQEDLQAPMNKQGAHFFLNQNSREPVTEPDEMVPLWKILKTVGADWTYSDVGWAAENYCLFAADNESWKKNVEAKAKAVDDLGCKVWLNTE